MIEEEYPISIEDLKKKFQNWFGKPVPADPPLPAEAERSIGKPVPVNLSLPDMADGLDHKTRIGNEDNSQNLSELLNAGFRGAVTSGAMVGFILVILNLGFWGWYSDNWPSQLFILFLAILLGFYIGLSKGYISQQREKYFYEGEF
ncbi:MAG: hypothetical protein JW963_17150 [Anaerolineales bacterium]|nr:hypothetical protein [Anaerolineales bacterium]